MHDLNLVHCLFEPHCESITEEAQQDCTSMVPGAPVVGEPSHKVALRVFEASAGNHKAVHRREMYPAVTIIANRTWRKLSQDIPC